MNPSTASSRTANAASKCLMKETHTTRTTLHRVRCNRLNLHPRKNSNNNNMSQLLSFTSSATHLLPSSNIITQSIRQKVKASFLQEAGRPDSRLWTYNRPIDQSSESPLLQRKKETRETANPNGIYHRNNDNAPIQSSFYQSLREHPRGGVNDPIRMSENVRALGHEEYDTDDDSNNHNSNDNDDDSLHDLDLQHITSTRYWPNLPQGVSHTADPFRLAQSELETMEQSIRTELLGTDLHPVLQQAASYFFQTATTSSQGGGKKIRPLMVLLVSRALSETAMTNDIDPTTTITTQEGGVEWLLIPPLSGQRRDLPAAQRRLAEISEMIHTASLFHDDVVDQSDTRRLKPTAHTVFGNKTAILAGDYLLARASIALARLRHVHVVETMSTIIEHLVRGEVMQMRGNGGITQVIDTDASNGITSQRQRCSVELSRMQYYLQKNFYKTASLMANSCKSAALLGSYSKELVQASYDYGKHVGMAFQLVDDALDFEGTLSQLGKPSLVDLKAGLATAPVLFAAQEYGELYELMDRKFQEAGDVERAVELVFASNGLERTKELARVHSEVAMDSILTLRPSEHRDSLVHLAHKVVARST